MRKVQAAVREEALELVAGAAVLARGAVREQGVRAVAPRGLEAGDRAGQVWERRTQAVQLRRRPAGQAPTPWAPSRHRLRKCRKVEQHPPDPEMRKRRTNLSCHHRGGLDGRRKRSCSPTSERSRSS